MNIKIIAFIIICNASILNQMCSNDPIDSQYINTICQPSKWKTEEGKENHLYDLIKKDDYKSATLYLKYCANPHGCTHIKGKDCHFPLSAVKNIQTADILIKHGAEIDKKDKNGKTSLHHAIINKNHKAIDILINKGANIHEKDNQKLSSIHYAAINGDEKTIDKLIASNVDINSKDENNRSALHNLIIRNKTQRVDPFIPNEIMSFRNDEIMKTILDQNNIKPITHDEIVQRTSIVKKLILAGIDINNRDINGFTALHYAVLKGELHIGITIMFYGQADVNIGDKNGGTPLHWSLIMGSNSFVDNLIEANANMNPRDKSGQTPLHWVARLSDNNANLNNLPIKDASLIKFYGNKHYALDTILTSRDININSRDNMNNTPLKLSKIYGKKEITDYLLKHNAK